MIRWSVKYKNILILIFSKNALNKFKKIKLYFNKLEK